MSLKLAEAWVVAAFRGLLGIEPNTMIQELDPQQEPRELPPIRPINLSDVRIDDRLEHDVRKPLTGVFTFEMYHNPDPPRGTLVLFFQLVTAQSWTVLTTCQRISNVLARVIEVV